MKTLAMISIPHLLVLWLLLIAFFVGAFMVLMVRGRKAKQARSAGIGKESQKKDT